MTNNENKHDRMDEVKGTATRGMYYYQSVCSCMTDGWKLESEGTRVYDIVEEIGLVTVIVDHAMNDISCIMLISLNL